MRKKSKKIIVPFIFLFLILQSCSFLSREEKAVDEILLIIENQDIDGFKNLSASYVNTTKEGLASFYEIITPLYNVRPSIKIQDQGDGIYSVSVLSSGSDKLVLDFKFKLDNKKYTLVEDFKLSKSLSFVPVD